MPKPVIGDDFSDTDLKAGRGLSTLPDRTREGHGPTKGLFCLVWLSFRLYEHGGLGAEGDLNIS